MATVSMSRRLDSMIVNRIPISFSRRLGGIIASHVPLPSETIGRLLELQRLAQLLKNESVNIVLDVGANRGQFAHWLRAIGYTNWIVSFEPVAREFGALQQAFASDPRWRGFNVALGEQEAQTTINVFPSESVCSSILPLRAAELTSTTQTSTTQVVEVKRLDAFRDELATLVASPRLFLKTDTQGYDLAVFRGASGVLDLVVGLQGEIAATAVYENEPRWLDVLAAYEASGFHLVGLSEVTPDPSGLIKHLNCVMRRG